ncbi:unnamed protein product [Amoebophrya sp. A120]|nr:unnamed protein product [Amoebophrya sp. A120]|eukprot:GSA120T00000915001.1
MSSPRRTRRTSSTWGKGNRNKLVKKSLPTLLVVHALLILPVLHASPAGLAQFLKQYEEAEQLFLAFFRIVPSTTLHGSTGTTVVSNGHHLSTTPSGQGKNVLRISRTTLVEPDSSSTQEELKFCRESTGDFEAPSVQRALRAEKFLYPATPQLEPLKRAETVRAQWSVSRHCFVDVNDRCLLVSSRSTSSGGGSTSIGATSSSSSDHPLPFGSDSDCGRRSSTTTSSDQHQGPSSSSLPLFSARTSSGALLQQADDKAAQILKHAALLADHRNSLQLLVTEGYGTLQKTLYDTNAGTEKRSRAVLVLRQTVTNLRHLLLRDTSRPDGTLSSLQNTWKFFAENFRSRVEAHTASFAGASSSSSSSSSQSTSSSLATALKSVVDATFLADMIFFFDEEAQAASQGINKEVSLSRCGIFASLDHAGAFAQKVQQLQAQLQDTVGITSAYAVKLDAVLFKAENQDADAWRASVAAEKAKKVTQIAELVELTVAAVTLLSLFQHLVYLYRFDCQILAAGDLNTESSEISLQNSFAANDIPDLTPLRTVLSELNRYFQRQSASSTATSTSNAYLLSGACALGGPTAACTANPAIQNNHQVSSGNERCCATVGDRARLQASSGALLHTALDCYRTRIPTQLRLPNRSVATATLGVDLCHSFGRAAGAQIASLDADDGHHSFDQLQTVVGRAVSSQAEAYAAVGENKAWRFRRLRRRSGGQSAAASTLVPQATEVNDPGPGHCYAPYSCNGFDPNCFLGCGMGGGNCAYTNAPLTGGIWFVRAADGVSPIAPGVSTAPHPVSSAHAAVANDGTTLVAPRVGFYSRPCEIVELPCKSPFRDQDWTRMAALVEEDSKDSSGPPGTTTSLPWPLDQTNFYPDLPLSSFTSPAQNGTAYGCEERIAVPAAVPAALLPSSASLGSTGFTMEAWVRFLEPLPDAPYDDPQGRFAQAQPTQVLLGRLFYFFLAVSRDPSSSGHQSSTTTAVRLSFFHRGLTMNRGSFPDRRLHSAAFALPLLTWTHVAVVVRREQDDHVDSSTGAAGSGSGTSTSASAPASYSVTFYVNGEQLSAHANLEDQTATLPQDASSWSPASWATELRKEVLHLGGSVVAAHEQAAAGNEAPEQTTNNMPFPYYEPDLPILADFELDQLRVHLRALPPDALGYFTTPAAVHRSCGTTSSARGFLSAGSTSASTSSSSSAPSAGKEHYDLGTCFLNTLALGTTNLLAASARTSTGDSTVCAAGHEWLQHKCVQQCPLAQTDTDNVQFRRARSVLLYSTTATSASSTAAASSNTNLNRCDCVLGEYAVWEVTAIRLRGDGTVTSVEIFDESLVDVTTTFQSDPLDLSSPASGLVFSTTSQSQPQKVAVVRVTKGAGTATKLHTVEVQKAGGSWQVVTQLQDLSLARGVVYLHHQPTASSVDVCAPCPTASIGVSQRPRDNVFACKCSATQGQDSLGRCQTKRQALDRPRATIVTAQENGPAQRFVAPESELRLEFPSNIDPAVTDLAFASIRYAVAYSDYTESLDNPSVPAEVLECDESATAQQGAGSTSTGSTFSTEQSSGASTSSASGGSTTSTSSTSSDATFVSLRLPVLPHKNMVVRAIVCHPLHAKSAVTQLSFTTKANLPDVSCAVVTTGGATPASVLSEAPEGFRQTSNYAGGGGGAGGVTTLTTAQNVEGQQPQGALAYANSVTVRLETNVDPLLVPGVQIKYLLDKNENSIFDYQHVAGGAPSATTSTGASSTTTAGTITLTTAGLRTVTAWSTRVSYENSRRVSCEFIVEHASTARVNFEFGAATLPFRRGFSSNDQGYTFLLAPPSVLADKNSAVAPSPILNENSAQKLLIKVKSNRQAANVNNADDDSSTSPQYEIRTKIIRTELLSTVLSSGQLQTTSTSQQSSSQQTSASPLQLDNGLVADFAQGGELQLAPDSLLARPGATTRVSVQSTIKEPHKLWSPVQTFNVVLVRTQSPLPSLVFSPTEQLSQVSTSHPHAHWYPDDPGYRVLGDQKHTVEFLTTSNSNTNSLVAPTFLFALRKQSALQLNPPDPPSSGLALLQDLNSQNFSSLYATDALQLPKQRKDYNLATVRNDCNVASISSTTSSSGGSSVTTKKQLRFDTLCSFDPSRGKVTLQLDDDVALYAWHRDKLLSPAAVGRSPGSRRPPANHPDFHAVAQLVSQARKVGDRLVPTLALASSGAESGSSGTTSAAFNAAGLKFVLTHPTAERKYCVNVVPFSLVGGKVVQTVFSAGEAGAGETSTSDVTTKNRCLDNPRPEITEATSSTASNTVDLSMWQSVAPHAGQLTFATQALHPQHNLNLTLYTTVRRPGFLWALPRLASDHVLLMRERAPAPRLLRLGEAGVADSNKGRTSKEHYLLWSPEIYYGLHGDADADHTAPTSSSASSLQLYMAKGASSGIDLDTSSWTHASYTTLPAPSLRDVVTVTDAFTQNIIPIATSTRTVDLTAQGCAFPKVCAAPSDSRSSFAVAREKGSAENAGIFCAWVLGQGLRESLSVCSSSEPSSEPSALSGSVETEVGVRLEGYATVGTTVTGATVGSSPTTTTTGLVDPSSGLRTISADAVEIKLDVTASIPAGNVTLAVTADRRGSSGTTGSTTSSNDGTEPQDQSVVREVLSAVKLTGALLKKPVRLSTSGSSSSSSTEINSVAGAAYRIRYSFPLAELNSLDTQPSYATAASSTTSASAVSSPPHDLWRPFVQFALLLHPPASELRQAPGKQPVVSESGRKFTTAVKLHPEVFLSGDHRDAPVLSPQQPSLFLLNRQGKLPVPIALVSTTPTQSGRLLQFSFPLDLSSSATFQPTFVFAVGRRYADYRELVNCTAFEQATKLSSSSSSAILQKSAAMLAGAESDVLGVVSSSPSTQGATSTEQFVFDSDTNSAGGQQLAANTTTSSSVTTPTAVRINRLQGGDDARVLRAWTQPVVTMSSGEIIGATGGQTQPINFAPFFGENPDNLHQQQTLQQRSSSKEAQPRKRNVDVRQTGAAGSSTTTEMVHYHLDFLPPAPSGVRTAAYDVCVRAVVDGSLNYENSPVAHIQLGSDADASWFTLSQTASLRLIVPQFDYTKLREEEKLKLKVKQIVRDEFSLPSLSWITAVTLSAGSLRIAVDFSLPTQTDKTTTSSSKYKLQRAQADRVARSIEDSGILRTSVQQDVEGSTTQTAEQLSYSVSLTAFYGSSADLFATANEAVNDPLGISAPRPGHGGNGNSTSNSGTEEEVILNIVLFSLLFLFAILSLFLYKHRVIVVQKLKHFLTTKRQIAKTSKVSSAELLAQAEKDILVDMTDVELEIYKKQELTTSKNKQNFSSNWYQQRQNLIPEGMCVFCAGRRRACIHGLKSQHAKPNSDATFSCCNECFPQWFPHYKNRLEGGVDKKGANGSRGKAGDENRFELTDANFRCDEIPGPMLLQLADGNEGAGKSGVVKKHEKMDDHSAKSSSSPSIGGGHVVDGEDNITESGQVEDQGSCNSSAFLQESVLASEDEEDQQEDVEFGQSENGSGSEISEEGGSREEIVVPPATRTTDTNDEIESIVSSDHSQEEGEEQELHAVTIFEAGDQPFNPRAEQEDEDDLEEDEQQEFNQYEEASAGVLMLAENNYNTIPELRPTEPSRRNKDQHLAIKQQQDDSVSDLGSVAEEDVEGAIVLEKASTSLGVAHEEALDGEEATFDPREQEGKALHDDGVPTQNSSEPQNRANSAAGDDKKRAQTKDELLQHQPALHPDEIVQVAEIVQDHSACKVIFNPDDLDTEWDFTAFTMDWEQELHLYDYEVDSGAAGAVPAALDVVNQPPAIATARPSQVLPPPSCSVAIDLAAAAAGGGRGRFRGSSSTIAGPRHQDQAEREISANKKKTRSSTSPHLKKAKKRKNKSRKSSRHRRGSSSSSLGSSGAAGGPRAESSSSRRRRHRRHQSSSRGEAGRSTKREDHHFEAQGDHGADESSFRSHAQHSSKTRDAGGRGDGMEIHSGDMTSPNFSTASKTPVQHRSRSSKGDKKKRHKSKKSRKSHNTSSSSDTDEHKNYSRRRIKTSHNSSRKREKSSERRTKKEGRKGREDET